MYPVEHVVDIDTIARHVVSPFGSTNVIQAGVKVKRGVSLRERLAATDSSQLDLNPEAIGSLKMRLLRDAD